MIETYPIPISAEEFEDCRDDRVLPSECSPGERVAIMVELEQDANIAAARMFAEFSQNHKSGNMYDAVSLTLLYPDPSDDQSVRLKFNDNNYWQVARGEKWLDIVINDELAGITGGYLLDSIEGECDEEGLTESKLLTNQREEFLLVSEDDVCDEAANGVCLFDGVQVRTALSTWEYGRRP